LVVWITTAGATAFPIWNWRTLWDTSGQAVLGYAASQQCQCHAVLRAVRFGYAFPAIQDAISIPWLTWDFLRGNLPLGSFIASLLSIAALTVGCAAWFIRFAPPCHTATGPDRPIPASTGWGMMLPV